MSELCVVHLKKFDFGFETLDALARDVVLFGLEHHIGICFNFLDRQDELVRNASIKNHFLLSGSFVYQQADFLDVTEFFMMNQDDFKVAFYQKFAFFDELIDLLLRYHVLEIEIYITEDGLANRPEEFKSLEVERGKVVDTLYGELIKQYGLVFPDLKISVQSLD
jgi:hypothetical protein